MSDATSRILNEVMAEIEKLVGDKVDVHAPNCLQYYLSNKVLEVWHEGDEIISVTTINDILGEEVLGSFDLAEPDSIVQIARFIKNYKEDHP